MKQEKIARRTLINLGLHWLKDKQREKMQKKGEKEREKERKREREAKHQNERQTDDREEKQRMKSNNKWISTNNSMAMKLQTRESEGTIERRERGQLGNEW